MSRILVQSCCYPVVLPASQPPAPPHSHHTIMDLNVAMDEAAPPLPAPADSERNASSVSALSHDLLARMCDILRQHGNRGEQAVQFSRATCAAVAAAPEFADITRRTSLLRQADFSLLADAERLCSFSNVVNLLRLHAMVVLGPPRASLEWVSWSRSVGYSLGTLGLVSLFDLEHTFLRPTLHIPRMFNGCLRYFCRRLPKGHPWHSQAVQLIEPNIAYAVWFGGASAPAPVPLLPATYRSTLQNARTHYLLKNVVLTTSSVPGEGSQLVLPQMLQWFRSDFVEQLEPLEGLGDTPLLNYLKEALPAGSRIHSVATNADASEVAFSAFSWAPLCDLSDIGPVDARQAPSKPLTVAAFSDPAEDRAQQRPRHFLQPATVDYLAGKNQVMATTALLLHPPLASSTKVFDETSSPG